jgi:glutaminyl-peptide cyclotransferase
MRKLAIPSLVLAGLLIITYTAWKLSSSDRHPGQFDGQRAYRDVLAQVAFGPRVPGGPAHQKTISYIQAELRKSGWKSEIQKTTWNGFNIQNIIAMQTSQNPQVILGAHYDSRMLADRDPDSETTMPVPGANDGASGVAVLLELARCLSQDDIPVWLVFFDAEDNGGLEGREWIMGSRAFVADLEFQPRAAIIVDMVGDADLNLYMEKNSTMDLVEQIWGQAEELGFESQFISSPKYSMFDDHTPFLEAGISAVDIIDFDYPYWHTTSDTADKVSPESLFTVGETLRKWIAYQK